MTAPELSVLIVDDEPPARQRLEQLVAELPGWRVAASCASGHEALAQVATLNPAVVLLDIRMPGMDGLETAQHLSVLDQAPAVIFTTAYDKYALAAFDAQAVGYLLKPIRRERLADALTRARRLRGAELSAIRTAQQPAARRTHMAVRVREQLRLIPLREIQFFRAELKYVTIVTSSGEELTDESLKDLAAEFGDDFVRVHRSYLVAIRAVAALERDAEGHWWISLRDSARDRLPVSRRQLALLKQRIGRSRVDRVRGSMIGSSAEAETE
jgi:two-component system response regulator AlgR